MKLFGSKFLFFFFSTLILICCSCKEGAKGNSQENNAVVTQQKPNIIYILADDLGYGDLACYGQEKIETPNIDRLALRGMKFTQHYSGSSVCAPSRSALMTGEHTGHTPIRGNKEAENNGEGQVPMDGNAITIAEVLKSAGYVTGAFGKWGLGYPGSEGDANMQGFDTFYGYNCQRLAHRYYPPYLRNNQEKDFLEGNDWTHTVTYAPDKIQDQALKFLEDNKGKAFFAYLPYTLPHAELISPNDSILRKYEGKFEETPYTIENSYTSDYGADIVQKEYCSQKTPHAAFASMIHRLDVYVGQVMNKLEELGIADNTIVMFASDNGPHAEGGADPDFFNSGGGLRGIKRDLYEGGIRSPFIAVWPNKIKGGVTSDHISAFWDVMPTVAEIAGVQTPENSDGISFLPTLLSQNDQKKHGYLYWEFHSKYKRQAARKGDWKGVLYNKFSEPGGEIELYNLAMDPSENNNVANEHPEIVSEMSSIFSEAHKESELFPF